MSPEQAYNEAYDQACAQYERAEKLEVELATERARCVALLQAKTELIDAVNVAIAPQLYRYQRLKAAAERLWEAAQPIMDENYEVVSFAVRGDVMDGIIELLSADAERG